MKIKAYTSYSERTNTHYYTTFEVVDELPEVGEYIDEVDGSITEIDSVLLDCEQGNDEVWSYDYFCVTAVDTSGEEWSYYYATKRIDEDD